MDAMEFKSEFGREGRSNQRGRHLGNYEKRPLVLSLLLSVLLTISSLGAKVKPASAIDLLPFFCPDCVGQSYGQRNHVGGECFYTYSATVKGKSGFYIVKSCNDPTFFEEFNYDDNFIYHLADTTWATYQNGTWTDARCDDGRLAYSTYLHGAFGQQNGPCDGFTPHMANEGNVWVPRYMNVGDTDFHNTTIVALAKDNCSCCQARYTGPTGRWVKLVTLENLDLGNGLGREDVIRIAIMDGPGKGENFWYARNYGWVGFGHVDPPDGPKSLFDVTHITGVDNNGIERQWTCSLPPLPLPSLTGGKVLGHDGRTQVSPPPNTSRNANPVQPGEARQAEEYWGLKGIDWAGKPGWKNCPHSNHTYLVGWHQGDLAEYLVNFPSASETYTFNVIGIPDDPKPVIVNVYIDGQFKGEVQWNDGDPRCNEGETGNSQKIRVRGYQGVHAVAFEFANDYYVPPYRDELSRDFYFDYFRFTRESGPVVSPDVYIEDLWWTPSRPQPGDQVQFNVRVRNGGNGATGTDVGVGYFVDGNYVGWGIRGPMSAGEVSSSFSMVQRWTATAGSHQIRALVDDINRFQESNEGNNSFTKILNVGGSSNPYPNCPCRSDINNYCLHAPSTPGCPMTFPGGYCDPNGDGSFTDGDWNRGYYEFQQYCR